METGAPEPCLRLVGSDLWIAYRAINPNFPGWEHPGALDYLDSHSGEPFGILRFEQVHSHSFGPPTDERQHEHPLYGHGLTFYEFHIVTGTQRPTWIITFHDETFEVEAAQAFVVADLVFAENAELAIKAAMNPRVAACAGA
jgi:hypothetical protein